MQLVWGYRILIPMPFRVCWLAQEICMISFEELVLRSTRYFSAYLFFGVDTNGLAGKYANVARDRHGDSETRTAMCENNL